MSAVDRVGTALTGMARLSGVQACGVVDLDSGMVLAHAGDANLVAGMESACDLWRMQGRRQELHEGGPCRAIVMIQEKSRTTLTACGGRYVLVCFTREPDEVLWSLWKRHVAVITTALQAH